jgi:hypothetical protein
MYVGMNSAHSQCLPVFNTVLLVTNLDPENGNKKKRKRKRKEKKRKKKKGGVHII